MSEELPPEDGEALIEALAHDDRLKIRRLLAAGASLDVRDDSGRGPLHLARTAATLELLLTHGAGQDVDVRDELGMTPLMLHAARGAPEGLPAVELLLEHGADPSLRQYGTTALTWAARADDLDVVARLLAAGCPIDAEPGHTGPLHVAAARGRYALAQLLLERGAAIEAVDLGPFGALTPLHLAAIYGHDAIVELMLEHGASPRALVSEASEDWVGYTPVHFATEHGHVDALAALLRRDPHAIALTTAAGKRPWDLAEDRLVRALLLTVGRGASVDEFERLRAKASPRSEARRRTSGDFLVAAIAPESLPEREAPEALRRIVRPQDQLHPTASGMWLWLRPMAGGFEVALADGKGVLELRERVRVREPVAASTLDGRRVLLACRDRGIVEVDLHDGGVRGVLPRERLGDAPVRALGLFGELGRREAAGLLVHAGDTLVAWALNESNEAPWWSYSTEPIRAVFMPAGPLVVLTPRASLSRALFCVADRSGLRAHSRFEPRVMDAWAVREGGRLRWFAASGRGETWELHGVADLRSEAEVLEELPDSDGMRAFAECDVRSD